jgi:IS4 transposase
VRIGKRKTTKCRRKERTVPGRESRIAHLEVRAGRREIFRHHGAAPHIPEAVALNFVEVRETKPPPGEQPVVWRLATTEPIGTKAEVARVVDAYRARWSIEEFFKVLKTGCRYQQIQLESMRALVIALAIEVAVAWKLLLLKCSGIPSIVT